MRAALTRQRVFLAALAVLVVVLVFGSVRTTGALWADQANGPTQDLHTGTFGLSPGSGSGNSFTFGALTKSNMVVNDTISATLNIVNTGSTPLRFQLASAAVTGLSPGGTTVVMNLAGTIGSCPGAGTAFAAANTPITTASAWLPLAKGGNTAWCITAKLVSVTPSTSSASFNITFNFNAEQTRP